MMSSGTGGVWQQAIEAGAAPLAVIKAQGYWDRLNEQERAVLMKAATGQAAEVLAAAWPLLRDALAEEMRKQNTVDRDSAHAFGPYTCGVHDGIDRAADVVARFTPETQPDA